MRAIAAGQLVRCASDIEWLAPDSVGEVLKVTADGLLVSWWWHGTRLVVAMDSELVQPAFPPGWDPENQ